MKTVTNDVTNHNSTILLVTLAFSGTSYPPVPAEIQNCLSKNRSKILLIRFIIFILSAPQQQKAAASDLRATYKQHCIGGRSLS